MNQWDMISFLDMKKYQLPNEVITGGSDNVRSLEDEFPRQALLGEGPNSRVYRVREQRTNKIVALKQIIHPGLKSGMPKDILREITILRNLNHENIIKLFNVYMEADPEHLLLTFENCKSDLSDYIRAHQNAMIGHNQVKCIMLQLFKGLNYLHKNFIVHRDIKPQNLLVSEEGQLKIADFGSSRRFSHLNPPTTPAQITLCYQAPELLFEAPRYDEKVDIWSAGCVLVEIIIKKPFFDVRGQIDLIKGMCFLLGHPSTKTWPEFNQCRAHGKLNFSNFNNYDKLTDRLLELKCGLAEPFLKQIFVYNPRKRVSAENCIRHDWFEQSPFPSKSIIYPQKSSEKYYMIDKR